MLSLDPTPASVAVAREHVAAVCGGLHLSDDRRETACLIISELVSNAIRYGGPPILYGVYPDGDVVLISVEDGSALPLPAAPDCSDLDAEGGRGLFLVAHLAHAGDGARP